MQPHYERVSRLFNGPDAVHPGIILMTRVDCALKVFMLPHFLITFFAGCHIFYVGVMGITFLIFSFYGRCWYVFPLLKMTTEFYEGHDHRNPINNTNVQGRSQKFWFEGAELHIYIYIHLHSYIYIYIYILEIIIFINFNEYKQIVYFAINMYKNVLPLFNCNFF